MAETYFNTETGGVFSSLVEAERNPDINASTSKLAELLLGTEFRYTIASYPKMEAGNMSREDYVELGKWVLTILDESPELEQPRNKITEPLLQRLYILGVGPERQRYTHTNHFDNIADFREAIGAPRGQAWGEYSEWHFENFVEHARMVARSKKGKPIGDDYDELARQGQGPSAETIWTHAGPLDDLHELIGFPNIRTMTDEDLVDWGVKAVMANGEGNFVWLLMDILSRGGLGPSYNLSRKRFGSWPNYKQQVFAAIEQKVARYHDMLDAGDLPAGFRGMEPAKLFPLAARYLVAQESAPGLQPSTLRRLSRTRSNLFVPAVLEAAEDVGLTAGHIETTALRLHLFDDIWPMYDHMKVLKVDESELAQARHAYTQKRQHYSFKSKIKKVA